MTDVIFNGSNNRKPAGQASVELILITRITPCWEYAAYSEISIRRLVTRDGSRSIFSTARSAAVDIITDIFLGTGLRYRAVIPSSSRA